MNPLLDIYFRLSAPLSFGASTRAETWQLMADLLASKIDTGRALDLAATMYRQRGRAGVAWTLLKIRASIGTGDFSRVAARYASTSEALLLSRYDSADPERMFAGAARIARSEQQIRAAIVNATAGPALMFLMLGVLFYILGVRLFPTMATVAPPSTWPPQSVLVANVSGFVVHHHWSALAVVLAIFAIYRGSLSLDFPGRNLLDRMPPWSFYKLRAASAFMFGLIEIARTGGDIKSATLEEMGRNASPYAKARIGRIAEELPRANIGEAAMRAGDSFPAPDLNTVLAALAAQEGWVERFSLYLDRWIAGVEQTVKRAANVLNVVMVSAVVGIMIAALSAISGVFLHLQ